MSTPFEVTHPHGLDRRGQDLVGLKALSRDFPTVDSATAEMARIAWRVREAGPDALTERFLRQASRELMLAQGSDWPFLVKTATAGDYPTDRFRRHIADFTRLAESLSASRVAHDVPLLESLEARDNVFQDLDWKLWCF